MPPDNRIVTILGPTATGKTRIAVRLAAELNAEIVSADSRQVYRRMDIGTGKDLSEYVYQDRLIPCHLLNIVEPGIEYNVFQYQQAAYQVIREIEQRHNPVVLCGGSGMYVEAVLQGYKMFPVPDNPVRKAELEMENDEKLIQHLSSFKTLHNHTDTDERPRLIKAIMIEEYYAQHPELMETSRALPHIIFGLHGNRDEIRRKITARLYARLEEGMVDEVQHLLDEGVNPNQLIRYGLEYKFLTQYIQGDLSYADMVDKLNVAIHQFSKRQMTWFRRMERHGMVIHWIDVSMPDDDKLNFILSKLVETR